MNWSTEKPTKPGCHWWRRLSTDVPTAVEITIDGQEVLRVGFPASMIKHRRLSDTKGEWTERIEMPFPSWTINTPTIPGWYWYRKYKQEEQVLMGLYSLEGVIIGVGPSGRAELVTDMPGEWSGPLERPQ